MDNSTVGSKRASTRYSTYSHAPSVGSVKTSLTSDSAQQELNNIESQLAILDNKKLASQRYALSEERTEEFGKLALAAKIDRSVGRRMKNQDAVMTSKKVKGAASKNEKGSNHSNEKYLVSDLEKVPVA